MLECVFPDQCLRVCLDDSDSYDMAPVQRGLYLSGQPLDHEPSLGQVPVVSLAAASPPGPGSDVTAAWLPPTHQFSANRLRYGAPPIPPPPPPQSPVTALVMQGLPPPLAPAGPASGLGAPPPQYPTDMNCDAPGDVLQYQPAAGSTQNAGAGGRVEVF